MHDLELAGRRAPHGFYLLNPRDETPFEPHPDAGSPYLHRFSYKRSATSLADTAVEIVRGARRKVFLASFRIGDGPLLNALYEAVDRLRGGVYVITSWDAEGLRKGLAGLGDDDELTEDEIKVQNKRFDDMTRRGIAVRGHPSCQAKFLVVDDTVALVSSANLETSALRDTPGGRAVTGESGALITDAAEVLRLARFFTRHRPRPSQRRRGWDTARRNAGIGRGATVSASRNAPLGPAVRAATDAGRPRPRVPSTVAEAMAV